MAWKNAKVFRSNDWETRVRHTKTTVGRLIKFFPRACPLIARDQSASKARLKVPFRDTSVNSEQSRFGQVVCPISLSKSLNDTEERRTENQKKRRERGGRGDRGVGERQTGRDEGRGEETLSLSLLILGRHYGDFETQTPQPLAQQPISPGPPSATFRG